MSHQAPQTSNAVESLTRIWKRVLNLSEVRVGDDFFDLCTDDALADRLFAEIAREFGRELPTATICYARTVAALAGILEQPALPQFPAFVELKRGEKKNPVFIFPGVGGRASFSDLAKNIATPRAIYGLQARGVDGREEPLDRMEDMAAYYLPALREMQPHGPYFLLGYSFGGLLALEMAQRLTAVGESTALLAMMDTYPDARYLPVLERVKLVVRRGKSALRARRAKKDHSPSKTAAEISPLSFAATMERVQQSDFRAMAQYRPKFYKGKIHFVKPAIGSFLPTNPVAIWGGLSAQFAVEAVPGDHVGMVAIHFKSLAAVLSRYLREAGAV
jgi:thioesterase domain-containing protein